MINCPENRIHEEKNAILYNESMLINILTRIIFPVNNNFSLKFTSFLICFSFYNFYCFYLYMIPDKRCIDFSVFFNAI